MKQVRRIRVVHCFSQAALLGMSWWFGMFCDFVCFGICFVICFVTRYVLLLGMFCGMFCVWMCNELMGSLGLMGISHHVT